MPGLMDSSGATIRTPATNRNVQTPAAQATGTANPAPPEDHAQQTPEFLQELITALRGLVAEQSALFAKMYTPHPMISHEGPETEPPYEVLTELRRQDAELDSQIFALKHQLRELPVLLARPGVTPSQELSRVTGPTGPALAQPMES